MNVEATAKRGVPTSEYLDIPVVSDKERLGFNVREFVKQWGLNAALGGGYHMYRQVWDETVTGLYGAVFGKWLFSSRLASFFFLVLLTDPLLLRPTGASLWFATEGGPLCCSQDEEKVRVGWRLPPTLRDVGFDVSTLFSLHAPVVQDINYSATSRAFGIHLIFTRNSHFEFKL